MKKILFILLIVMFAGCNKESNPDAIRKEISKKREQIGLLNQEIATLEGQLATLGVDLNENARQAVSIQELKPSGFNHSIKVNGIVEAVNQAYISPEINGQIEKVFVKKGQRVEAGQTLIKLNTTITDNSILEIKTSLELAKVTFEKQKELWDQQIGSELQYLQAKTNKESLEARLKTLESQRNMAVIKAPFNGIIDDIMVKEGELAMPGQKAVLIVNLAKLYVNCEISESYLPLIKEGDQSVITFATYPDLEIKSPVIRVGNVINPENRTFKVQFLINNQGEKIKPNLVASVSLKSFEQEDAILVPSILIKQDEGGSFVYLAGKEGNEIIARKQYVDRGTVSENKTLIIKGLNPGDSLIVQGHNQISDGKMIKLVDGNELIGLSNK